MVSKFQKFRSFLRKRRGLKILGSLGLGLALGFLSLESITPSVQSSPNQEQILKEFKKAQSLELKALEHSNQNELKEFEVQQKNQRKEFNDEEIKKVKAYMKEPHKGPEKRTFTKASIERRKQNDSMIKQNLKTKKAELENRIKDLKQDQKNKLQEVTQILKEGKIPPESLWPAVQH